MTSASAASKKSAVEDLTPDEASRFEQAMKDPEFMKLFADYARELQDPKTLAEYTEYLRQLEAENASAPGSSGLSSDLILPEPCFCFKVKQAVDQSKIFVNVCSSDRIAPAEQMQNKEWRLPLSLGPARPDSDAHGEKCQVVDIVYNPESVKKSTDDFQFKTFLVDVALDYVEQKHRLKLDRKTVKTLSKKSHGTPVLQSIRRTGAGADRSVPTVPSLAATTSPKIEEISSAPALSKQASAPPEIASLPVPKYEIVHRGEFDMSDFMSTGSQQRRLPRELEVRIHVPLCAAASDLDVDVEPRRILFSSAKLPKAYGEMQISLPFECDADAASARFVKSEKKLLVTIPVVGPAATSASPSSVSSSSSPSSSSSSSSSLPSASPSLQIAPAPLTQETERAPAAVPISRPREPSPPGEGSLVLPASSSSSSSSSSSASAAVGSGTTSSTAIPAADTNAAERRVRFAPDVMKMQDSGMPGEYGAIAGSAASPTHATGSASPLHANSPKRDASAVAAHSVADGAPQQMHATCALPPPISSALSSSTAASSSSSSSSSSTIAMIATAAAVSSSLTVSAKPEVAAAGGAAVLPALSSSSSFSVSMAGLPSDAGDGTSPTRTMGPPSFAGRYHTSGSSSSGGGNSNNSGGGSSNGSNNNSPPPASPPQSPPTQQPPSAPQITALMGGKDRLAFSEGAAVSKAAAEAAGGAGGPPATAAEQDHASHPVFTNYTARSSESSLVDLDDDTIDIPTSEHEEEPETDGKSEVSESSSSIKHVRFAADRDDASSMTGGTGGTGTGSGSFRRGAAAADENKKAFTEAWAHSVREAYSGDSSQQSQSSAGGGGAGEAGSSGVHSGASSPFPTGSTLQEFIDSFQFRNKLIYELD